MFDEIRLLIKDWEHCLETGNAVECFKLGQLLIALGATFDDEAGVWQINLNGNALSEKN